MRPPLAACNGRQPLRVWPAALHARSWHTHARVGARAHAQVLTVHLLHEVAKASAAKAQAGQQQCSQSGGAAPANGGSGCSSFWLPYIETLPRAYTTLCCFSEEDVQALQVRGPSWLNARTCCVPRLLRDAHARRLPRDPRGAVQVPHAQEAAQAARAKAQQERQGALPLMRQLGRMQGVCARALSHALLHALPPRAPAHTRVRAGPCTQQAFQSGCARPPRGSGPRPRSCPGPCTCCGTLRARWWVPPRPNAPNAKPRATAAAFGPIPLRPLHQLCHRAHLLLQLRRCPRPARPPPHHLK